MNPCEQLLLQATYNQWMNAKVYEACGRLSAEQFAAERGAFFGSLLGTLNHLAVADTVWLRRFAAHPAGYAALDEVRGLPQPAALDQKLYTGFAELKAYREKLDRIILDWIATVREPDLDQKLEYRSMKGIAGRKRLGDVLLHFFNHQTHHRGQATTLLMQAGQDVGVTDLLVLIPDGGASVQDRCIVRLVEPGPNLATSIPLQSFARQQTCS